MANIMDSALACIDAAREESDEALLFLSLGKDSLTVLDMAAPRFRRIVGVFMYFVPGLEHIERWIRWAKARYANLEMVQAPHWSLSYMLRSGLCCVPDPGAKVVTLGGVVAAMRRRTGIGNVFLGMKKADGLNRRLMLQRYAAESYRHGGMCYPLAEWTQKDVLAYMRQHRLPEPVRYGKNASGGVGLNLDCLRWMREHFPGDLQKVYAAFPLAERLLWEDDRARCPALPSDAGHDRGADAQA